MTRFQVFKTRLQEKKLNTDKEDMNLKRIMKTNKLLYCIFLVVCAIATSCNSSNEQDEMYSDWRIKNQNYFKSMKDSSDYHIYNIPTSRGGGSFYYKILKNGNLPVDSLSEYTVVNISCRGKLINGLFFANTFDGDPILSDSTSFSYLEQAAFLVKGFQENLRSMKVGEVRRFVLPQELGYRDLKDLKKIPPYSVTIWDVYLKNYYN